MKIFTRYRQATDAILDLLYPRRCPVCDDIIQITDIIGHNPGRASLSSNINASGYDHGRASDPDEIFSMIHRKCLAKIKTVSGPTCLKCGKPLIDDTQMYCQDCQNLQHDFDRGFSVFMYRSISGSVYRFKYQKRAEYGRFYGYASAKMLGRKLKGLGAQALLPVPMYKGKERARGYNQAEVFARELSYFTGIPVNNRYLVRTRNTIPQKELDARGRMANLKNAFNIGQNDVKFKCVIIVDDIYTTGSTIDAIARMLHRIGVERVYFVTLAIGQIL